MCITTADAGCIVEQTFVATENPKVRRLIWTCKYRLEGEFFA